MGTDESKIQFCTQQQYNQYQRQQKDSYEQKSKKQSFYKVQQCAYPHPLMERTKTGAFEQGSRKRCMMEHQANNGTFNLCTKCEKYPQKIRKDQSLHYKSSTYEVERPQPAKYNKRNPDYRQKDINAPGPQVPGFYNGFTLPLDRYYRQKTQFTTDYDQPISHSKFRNEDNKFQQSIYEEQSERKHPRAKRQIEIDLAGFQQNLRI